MKIEKLIEVAENDNWEVNIFPPHESCDHFQLEFEKHTDFSNYDFIMSIDLQNDDPTELLQEIKKYYDDFDPEEEAIIWIGDDGHGKNGAPHSLKDIIKSMEEAKRMVIDLWRKMRNSPSEIIKNIQRFKAYYREARREVIEADHNDALMITNDLVSFYQLSDNYYGECFIFFRKSKIDVESIWIDGTSDVYVHINCEAFECDISLKDLSVKNAKRVFRFIYRKYMERVNTGYYDNI